jgi:acetyl esterase/lipase
LQDAQRAVRTVRSRAKEWGVKADRIGILGFSAGGHLASTGVTHFDDKVYEARDEIDKASARPDFGVLVYPVISFTEPFTHVGSRQNLLGADASEELMEKFSNERQVTPQTPPCFLISTWEDTGVPAENSIYFYLALRKVKVPAELHVFAKGPHGFGLGQHIEGTSAWPTLCQNWMKVSGFLGQ